MFTVKQSTSTLIYNQSDRTYSALTVFLYSITFYIRLYKYVRVNYS